MSVSAKTPAFARFLSSVKGHLVSRYGSGGHIGALHNPDTGQLEWDTEQIVALSAQEATKFRREYDRAVNTGALKERKESEYLAALKKQQAKEKKARAEAKAKAEAEKKESEATGAATDADADTVKE